MGIHGYRYYDTRTYLVNMQVSKILIPAGSGYPFLIFVSYPLRVLSTDTRKYKYFWHPYLGLWYHVENKEVYEERDYVVLTVYNVTRYMLYTHKTNPKKHK